MEKIKNLRIMLLTGIISALSISSCFADNSGLSSVTTAITSASTDLLGEATPIIASAVGIGITFWGAKMLWSKFKSMSK